MSDIKTFLKQHSTIPNKFIDSFLSFYNPETIQTDFVINCDNVSDWLQIPKYKIINTLTTSYKLDIDYTITKGSNKGIRKYGGNNYKIVMLTP